MVAGGVDVEGRSVEDPTVGLEVEVTMTVDVSLEEGETVVVVLDGELVEVVEDSVEVVGVGVGDAVLVVLVVVGVVLVVLGVDVVDVGGGSEEVVGVVVGISLDVLGVFVGSVLEVGGGESVDVGAPGSVVGMVGASVGSVTPVSVAPGILDVDMAKLADTSLPRYL